MIDKVVWSATGAGDAPAEFSWPALGWTFVAEPEYRETLMTGEHTPRLEVGKSYLFALDRPAGYCRVASNEPTWRGSGASAVIPVEQGILGAGEFEGRTISPGEARNEWNQMGATLAASVSGRGVSALMTALAGAYADRVARKAAREEKCG